MSTKPTGTERTLGYLRRLMEGETLSVIGLLAEDPENLTDATVRRSMLLLEQGVPGVQRDAGRPANWRYVGGNRFRYCPFCGKGLS